MTRRRDEENSPKAREALSTSSDPSATGARSGKKTVPTWGIESLTEGGREALIRHAGEVYLLRITVNGKLILTK